MGNVTVGSAWTPPENYFKSEDGTYQVTLVRIGITERSSGEFVPGGTRSYEGQFGSKTVQDWTFALEDGQVIEDSVGAPRRTADGKDVIHPKSKYFGYLVALAGGKAIPEGTDFDPQVHLVGRMALATIQRDDKMYPRIVNLGAMPTTAKAAAAPVAEVPPASAPAATPLREQVAQSTAQAPF